MEEIVKMSHKGQLVVPQEIRNKEGFTPGDRFIPFQVKGGILFKKIKLPNVKAEFEKISIEIEKQFKKQNITSEDVDESVKWARKKLH